MIFTASQSSYASKVIDLLDPKREFISVCLFREHCHITKEGICIKDLRILSERDMKNVLIVDNSIYSYGFNLNNGVPIIPFYGDFDDTELEDLEKFLLQAIKFNDVRSIVSKLFKYDVYKKHVENENLLIKELIIGSSKLASEFITLL